MSDDRLNEAEAALISDDRLNEAEAALIRLARGNEAYMSRDRSPVDLSPARRAELAGAGQAPYAVIVTCSDSRVPPEHIFSVGLGELFVVRTAGNVVGDFERGSIEFAVQQLGAPLVVVMGHSQCGAVSAALAGSAEGYLDTVVREIQEGLDGTTNAEEAARKNIQQSIRRIRESAIVGQLVAADQLMVTGAEYDLQTGQVKFLPDPEDCIFA